VQDVITTNERPIPMVRLHFGETYFAIWQSPVLMLMGTISSKQRTSATFLEVSLIWGRKVLIECCEKAGPMTLRWRACCSPKESLIKLYRGYSLRTICPCQTSTSNQKNSEPHVRRLWETISRSIQNMLNSLRKDGFGIGFWLKAKMLTLGSDVNRTSRWW